mmetsp:Transcript_14533/g.35217  ORF Transcript_14533/g.35217 Transcript_14533/m.35217 type:complete len:237 (-) Transcript_14533:1198-1908(-)
MNKLINSNISVMGDVQSSHHRPGFTLRVLDVRVTPRLQPLEDTATLRDPCMIATSFTPMIFAHPQQTLETLFLSLVHLHYHILYLSGAQAKFVVTIKHQKQFVEEFLIVFWVVHGGLHHRQTCGNAIHTRLALAIVGRGGSAVFSSIQLVHDCVQCLLPSMHRLLMRRNEAKLTVSELQPDFVKFFNITRGTPQWKVLIDILKPTQIPEAQSRHSKPSLVPKFDALLVGCSRNVSL